ncbi:MAG: alpha/beta hydrolase [Rhodoglobus sp.]
MTTYVLVPGGWRGAWTWDAVVSLLESAGHIAHPVTLTGLGPGDDPEEIASANLDTHADDVLRLITSNHLTDVTLVGHSYGGMVVSVVADRAGGRVSRVVHLDAYVPLDGESCWSATNDTFRAIFAAGAAENGYTVRHPRRDADPRTRPHPLAAFMQAARLTGAVDEVPRRDFVYCSGWADTPFTELRDRLRDDPNWTVHDIPTGHDVANLAPEAVAAILLNGTANDSH